MLKVIPCGGLFKVTLLAIQKEMFHRKILFEKLSSYRNEIDSRQTNRQKEKSKTVAQSSYYSYS